MKTETIRVENGAKADFHNQVSYCVGTGRMGLALQEEYQAELAQVQALVGFSHIRGHGLFCDDMAIWQPYTDAAGQTHPGYCFTYLDRVMDAYRRLGLKPFLELGFMPQKMASGDQTIFYWKGNVTPPARDDEWTGLVRETLVHLAKRYGQAEVESWPVEVWNEPNLKGFWKDADQAAYLHLYEITARCVKEALPGIRVGGPAICGGDGSQEWIQTFLAFCQANDVPVDFVTRHAYMAEAPLHRERYLYHRMVRPEVTLAEMRRSREIIDSFPRYRGLEMHITEFNTSYNPLCPIHDTNLNAAYIAGLLGCLGDVAASYSYWTFGDVFEECGVPERPFHGGFGMVAQGCIPKPTLWSFRFFSRLTGAPVWRDASAVITRQPDGSYAGVAWNLCHDGREALALDLTLPEDGEWTLATETVDETCCNPLRLWHEMGEPASLTAEQLRFLRESGKPLCNAVCVSGADARLSWHMTLAENAVVGFTLSRRVQEVSRGYDYEWYLAPWEK